ncbi:CHAP domain-containing protein [Candidatus Roizmanbacteria bacterium]|nr:CHAP domain-containing protein [Candidatus Roizmanbacteria bacterium]
MINRPKKNNRISYLLIVVVFIIVSLLLKPASTAYARTQTDDSAAGVELMRDLLQLFFSFSSSQSSVTYPASTVPSPILSGLPSSFSSTLTPLPPGNPAAAAILSLVDEINSKCPNGIVSQRDEDCLLSIRINNQPLPADVLFELKPSTNCFGSGCSDYLQCVRFVKGAKILTGGVFDTYGNAIDYRLPGRFPTGTHFVEKSAGTPQSGDLPVWDYDTYGHMAYITTVYSPNDFEFAEANFDAPGHVRISRDFIQNIHLLGWLSYQ